MHCFQFVFLFFYYFILFFFFTLLRDVLRTFVTSFCERERFSESGSVNIKRVTQADGRVRERVSVCVCVCVHRERATDPKAKLGLKVARALCRVLLLLLPSWAQACSLALFALCKRNWIMLIARVFVCVCCIGAAAIITKFLSIFPVVAINTRTLQ